MEGGTSNTQEGFNSCIAVVQSISPEAAECVPTKHTEKWARVFFNGRRFGHLTSNVAESANAFISDLRTLHQTHLFAGFIHKINELFLRSLSPRNAVTLSVRVRNSSMVRSH